MVMFLRFGESPPKTENLIKRMDRPLPSFSAKITLFVTYADLNSIATNVAFRQSLLKLEMYLWKCRENRINFSLMIVFLSRTGTIFIQMLRSMIFLFNKGLIQRWRQCTTRSFSLWDIFCVKSISAWLTESYTLFYKQHSLNAAQLLPSQGKWQILSFKCF